VHGHAQAVSPIDAAWGTCQALICAPHPPAPAYPLEDSLLDGLVDGKEVACRFNIVVIMRRSRQFRRNCE